MTPDEVDRNKDIKLELNEETCYHEFAETERSWSRPYTVTPLSSVFAGSLWSSADMQIGGRSLRSFFNSEDRYCDDPKDVMETAHWMLQSLKSRRLFVSEGSRLGVAPALTRLGDIVVVLSSCNSPLVLRPQGDTYELVGSCYIDGLMDGEVAKGVDAGAYKLQEIRIR